MFDQPLVDDASMGPSMSIDGVSWYAAATRRSSGSGFNGAVDEHRRSHGDRRELLLRR